MTCGRCKGLMVNEWRPDFTPETFVWRCINCGHVFDPVLERNRRLHAAALASAPAQAPLDLRPELEEDSDESMDFAA